MVGGGGSKEKSESISFPVDMTPKQYVQLRSNVANLIRDYLKTEGGPQYTEPFAAPLTPGEEEALGWITPEPSANVQAAEKYISGVLGGAFQTPERNPILQSYIEAAVRPINEAYNQYDLENRALFSRAGHRIQESSPFSVAQAIQDRGRMQAIGDVTAKIAYPAYEAEADRMERAAQGAYEADQLRLEQNIKVLEARALPRLIAQYGLDQGYAEFQRRMALLMNILGVAGQITSPHLGQFSQAEGEKTEGRAGILQQG